MTIDSVREVPDFASMPDDIDPMAVIYVVNDARDEAGAIASEKDILQASSDALYGLLSSEDEEVVSKVREWTSGRIRKIVKRARGAAWQKVERLDLPTSTGYYNGVEVIVFAPMRISEQPKELKKLQVTGLNSDDAEPMEFRANEAHLLVKVNQNLNMSTGKVVAQVGHAIQLFLMYGEASHIEAWTHSGLHLKVVRSENLAETATTGIVVHDAGFTEVPSGSLTATAEYRFAMEGK
jgi:peptidyl-tRNA hydrolase